MCGIVGLIGTPDAAREAFLGLTTLQHRGQDAAGILSYDSDGFHRVKNIGLVESVFTRENMSTLTGNIAVGHARYSTIRRGDLIDVQPFLLSYPFGLGIVHNGNIVNTSCLAAELKKQNRRRLLTHSDTEIVLNILAEGLARQAANSLPNVQTHVQPSVQPSVQIDSQKNHEAEHLTFDQICSAVNEIFKRVNGSYSIVSMIADHGLVAFRDPYGIRPLVWGKRKVKRSEDLVGALDSGEAHMIASESVSLSFLGYDVVRHLEPGEVLFIDMKGNVHSRVLDNRGARQCMFEWVYFASPESVIDRVPVYGSRIQLGKKLARQIKQKFEERKIDADIIVPIPETSRIAAIALAEELKIPYREVLIKNRYIKRTFILDSQEKRQKAVNLKLSPVRSEIQGKRVILVDDSIVRGTTSKKIVELVRAAGAEKVYLVSTCPPIQHPCYYGIDFPVESELIASGRRIEQIEADLCVDALIYQDIDGLRQSICDAAEPVQTDQQEVSQHKFNPCTACLDGKYPTDVSAGVGFAAARTADRNERRSVKS